MNDDHSAAKNNSLHTRCGRTILLLAAAATFLVFSYPGYAAPVTWVPSGGGDLTTAANWSSDPLLPGSGDDVTINTTENATLTSGADLTYQSAVFSTTNYNHLNFSNADVELTITDALSVTSGRFIFGVGTFHITNDDETAVLSATGASGAYLDFIAGQSPIVVADKLNLSTNVEPWLAQEGELTVRNGATITTSSAVTFGRTTGYTFKTNRNYSGRLT